MKNSLDRIFDGILFTLKTEVLPRLDDEYARGQVLSAIDLLANLKPRIDWAIGPLWEQVEAQKALAARIAARFRGVPDGPPRPPVADLPANAAAAQVAQVRDRLDEHLGAVLHWLAAHEGHAASKETEAEIRAYMREELRRELAKTAKTLLAEISRGTER